MRFVLKITFWIKLSTNLHRTSALVSSLVQDLLLVRLTRYLPRWLHCRLCPIALDTRLLPSSNLVKCWSTCDTCAPLLQWYDHLKDASTRTTRIWVIELKSDDALSLFLKCFPAQEEVLGCSAGKWKTNCDALEELLLVVLVPGRSEPHCKKQLLVCFNCLRFC